MVDTFDIFGVDVFVIITKCFKIIQIRRTRDSKASFFKVGQSSTKLRKVVEDRIKKTGIKRL